MVVLMWSGVAMASGFRYDELPLALTFQYDWTTPVVSGVTQFTFPSADLRDDTAACASSGACMDGVFSTGNGGTGTFSTVVRVDDCTLRFGAYTVDGSELRVPGTCRVVQALEMFYDGTSASYSGQAELGTVSFERVFDCAADPSCPLDEDRSFVYRFVPARFEGTLGGPGVGVFHEI